MGLNLLMEKDASGTTKKTYTHGYSPIDGIGSVVVANDSVHGYQYPTYDHRGTVQEVLDDSETVRNDYEHNAFGEEEKRTEAETNRFTYQSNWYIVRSSDAAEAYSLSPARLYHAGEGRFLQRDLLQDAVLAARSSGGNAVGRWSGRIWADAIQDYFDEYVPVPVEGISPWLRIASFLLSFPYLYASNSMMSLLDPRGLRNVGMRIMYDFSGPNSHFINNPTALPAAKKEVDRIVQACVKQCVCKDAQGKPKHKVDIGWFPVSGKPSDLGRHPERRILAVREPSVMGVDLYIKTGKVLKGAGGGAGGSFTYQGIFDPFHPGNLMRTREYRDLPETERASHGEIVGRCIVHEAVFGGMGLAWTRGHAEEGYVDSEQPALHKGATLSLEACKDLCKRLEID